MKLYNLIYEPLARYVRVGSSQFLYRPRKLYSQSLASCSACNHIDCRHYNRQERVGAKLKLTIASTRRIVQGEKLDFWYLVAKIVQATINCTTTTEAGKIVMAPRNSIRKSRRPHVAIVGGVAGAVCEDSRARPLH